MKILRLVLAMSLVLFVLASAGHAQSDTPKSSSDEKGAPVARDEVSDRDAGKSTPATGTNRKPIKGKTTSPFKKKRGTATGRSDDTADGSTSPADGNGPADGNPKVNTKSDAKANAKAAEPIWQVEEIRISPHAEAKYVRDAVTVAPIEGNSLIEVRFDITALRAENKALERYFRMWTSQDRTELTRRAKSGARILESKNIALVDPAGKRFTALWSPDSGIRISIAHADIAPNRQSSHHSSSGTSNNKTGWLDAEQSFMTRITRPVNQPPITEYATTFFGLLKTDQSVSVTFLFSVPTSIDLHTLKLEVDSESFTIEE